MKTQFNILLATDYSTSTSGAEQYAIQLALATQSTIRFMHVFQPELIATSMSFDSEKIDYNPLKYAYDKLGEHIEECFRISGIQPGSISYTYVVREGNNIRKQILEEADEEDSNLIIVGTHGASLMHRLLLGSHTWNLIRHADIPVLAIPENTVFTEIKQIVFATEYREGEIPAIHFLAQIAKVLNAEIMVLHISRFVLSEEFENLLFKRFQIKVKNQIAYEKLHLKLIHECILQTGKYQLAGDVS
jgi:nucleotide-binding universal stress UspA family protein